LPEVVPSTFADRGVVAQIDGRDVRIAGAAGDQQAALFGQGCLLPGMAKNTYGTGCFLLMNTGPTAVASRHRLLTTIAWDLGERSYALEGSVFMGGAVVQWLRDGLGLIAQARDVEALAGAVNDSHGVIFVPAFHGSRQSSLGRRTPAASSSVCREATTRAHIARAALDAIAFQCAEVLAAMQQDAAQPLRELRVDGGATANNLLMQIQADLLGVPVIRPCVTETTALGAAYLGRSRGRLLVDARGSRCQLAHRSPVRARHLARRGRIAPAPVVASRCSAPGTGTTRARAPPAERVARARHRAVDDRRHCRAGGARSVVAAASSGTAAARPPVAATAVVLRNRRRDRSMETGCFRANSAGDRDHGA
jgi:glycerol kinase